ncbi:hypothetical protein Golax_018406 [Gossypium laxum]|uniref:Zinc knuckle CX2CX4HX4C domain-containing protein n=1 Tax=Gossypium laxum TaxID=34288 RepID=A0A7J8Z366_9ROSI|nr:hypothetical protein [Gossypium laxum]
MFAPGSCSYVSFKYERLTLFCFFCGKLGHNDSFYQAKMSLRVKVAEFGWDMSLKAQSKRALAISTVWLRDEDERMKGGSRFGGVPRDKGRMISFRGVLEECHLMDVGYSRVFFTWEKGNLPETNIKEHLGRGVANAE